MGQFIFLGIVRPFVMLPFHFARALWQRHHGGPGGPGGAVPAPFAPLPPDSPMGGAPRRQGQPRFAAPGLGGLAQRSSLTTEGSQRPEFTLD